MCQNKELMYIVQVNKGFSLKSNAYLALVQSKCLQIRSVCKNSRQHLKVLYSNIAAVEKQGFQVFERWKVLGFLV